jgi:hypothetical protein
MNNKLDKKHKRKQPKTKTTQPKNKKKTASRQSKKKKEIKNGGGFWSFSKNTGSYNPTTKNTSNKNEWKNPTTLIGLQQSLLSNSNRLENAQHANSLPPLRNVSQVQPQPLPPPPPNAQPQGLNTLKAQSRCSIL